MKKTFRRVLMLLLAAAVAASAPLTVSAAREAPEKSAETPEKSMETALIAIKSLFDIDDSVYTDFSYGSSFSNYETREGLVWSFQWSDMKSGYIYAEATEDGQLLDYWKYNYDENRFGFAEINKDEAISIAKAFIAKSNPDTYSFYKPREEVYSNINDGNYVIYFYAEVNGYGFPASRLSINVNKFTGEITSYGTSNINPNNYKFEAAESLISESAAIAAYIEKIGLKLEYRGYFDYEKGTTTVFPVYLFNSYGDRFISAKTGDVVEYVYDRGSDYFGNNYGADAPQAMATADSASGGGSRASLSPTEIAAVEKLAGFLTSEQALAKLLEAAELTDLDVSSFNDQYVGLSRDYRDKDRFLYDINLYKYYSGLEKADDVMYLYGRVDAATGKVMSFTYHYNDMAVTDDAGQYSGEKAQEATEAFLKKIAPDEFAKMKLETIESPESSPYSYRGINYYFWYSRYENGVPFSDNSINVTFNQYTGKVTSFWLNWYDNVTFPSVSDVLTPQAALEAFTAQNGSTIYYVTVGDGNAALVYDFRSRDYIDPFTGMALDYDGQAWIDGTLNPAYDDVKGHWSESVVMRLLDNGVYMWSGKFEPDKVMTEQEFLQYLLLIEPYYYYTNIDDFYSQRGVGITADPDKILTRQEAVRIIAEYLGYGKLGRQSEWFVYPFTDNVADEYKGYITICYMLGIIGGNNGRFDAMANITRAQAAVMLHNLIIAKN